MWKNSEKVAFFLQRLYQISWITSYFELTDWVNIGNKHFCEPWMCWSSEAQFQSAAKIRVTRCSGSGSCRGVWPFLHEMLSLNILTSCHTQWWILKFQLKPGLRSQWNSNSFLLVMDVSAKFDNFPFQGMGTSFKRMIWKQNASSLCDDRCVGIKRIIKKEVVSRKG